MFLCFVNYLGAKSGSTIEFCSDRTKVSNLFTMGDYTYAKKGKLFYQKPLNEKFVGKRSLPESTISAGIQ